jgi:hypothetical protein
VLVGDFKESIANQAAAERPVSPFEVDSVGQLGGAGIDIVAEHDERVIGGPSDLDRAAVGGQEQPVLCPSPCEQLPVLHSGIGEGGVVACGSQPPS